MRHVYAIALGSNRPLSARLTPRRLVWRAFVALDTPPLRLLAASPIVASAPLGPSRRTYANAAALVESALAPPDMLAHCKALERRFGRRATGQRWGARTLDLDLALWSGGVWQSRALTIPHSQLVRRSFVLAPLAAIAPRWRHPASGHAIAHLLHRAKAAKPVDRKRAAH